MSLLDLADDFFAGDSSRLTDGDLCSHGRFPNECRYCAANELGKLMRAEIEQGKKAETYFKAHKKHKTC